MAEDANMMAIRLHVPLLDRLRGWIDDLTAASAGAPEDRCETVTAMSYAEILAASAFLDFGGVPIDWRSLECRDEGWDRIKD
jgi:hypothetical protein